MSASWSWYIIVLTVVFTIAITWLLLANSTKAPKGTAPSDNTGHVWDEDITELNNPLPRWWFILFLLTILFTGIYLALYPGLGTFDGKLGWTSVQQADAELEKTNARLETLYAGFRDRPLAELANDPAATKVGRNVFANNRAVYASTRGAKGYRTSSTATGRTAAIPTPCSLARPPRPDAADGRHPARQRSDGSPLRCRVRRRP